jgi:uncharacterized membrane protein
MEKPLDKLNAPARRDEIEGEGAIRGTARMEAFADAVFAIAFTLPIVAIAVPLVSRPGNLLASDLLSLWPSLLGYLIASVIIGIYWVQHHFSGAIYRTTGHWFLLATVLFLTLIGFVAYPSRVFAEHLPDPAARPAGAQFLVITLSVTAATWLLKWTVGRLRGQVDARLDQDYVRRLDRRFRLLTMGHLIAAVAVFVRWEAGLALSALLTLELFRPPETPRYITRAPTVEGE